MHRKPPSIPGVRFYGQWKSGKKLYRLGRHKNTGLEVVLISKGELRWEIEGREYTLGPDTLFYTLPWQEHGGVEEIQPSSEIDYFCVSLDKIHTKARRQFGFYPGFGFSAREEKAISSVLTRGRAQAVPAGVHVQPLFDHFFRCAGSQDRLGPSRARECIKLIILELAERAGTARRAPHPAGAAERRVRDFARELARRHAEPWTLESMSEACGLGRSQFAGLLKKLAGDTPVTHLNRLRVQRAQELLRDSGKSITEIALEVGFNSSQYFATVFKEFTDMEARAWRAAGINSRAPRRAGTSSASR
ncbi:MAG TPA: AraC family transcriptional regulator [Candidatus Methylacidiphilales bacterium]|jgi:AraC family L-rhamnose operon regulatory protein RhaS|nr:AraC family transcriptional regulator [Candidatus Methylacidiphilales bacterium]